MFLSFDMPLIFRERVLRARLHSELIKHSVLSTGDGLSNLLLPISDERTQRFEITRVVADGVLRGFEQEGCVREFWMPRDAV